MARRRRRRTAAPHAAGVARATITSRYSAAKREGGRVVGDLVKGSASAVLSLSQTRDALAALEVLQGFYQSTGRRVSLLASVSELCEAARKPYRHGYSPGEAWFAVAPKQPGNVIRLAPAATLAANP